MNGDIEKCKKDILHYMYISQDDFIKTAYRDDIMLAMTCHTKQQIL